MSINLKYQLSEHFTWEDFSRTGNHLNNAVPVDEEDVILNNAELLCQNVLEKVWVGQGKIQINSGYRNYQLNKKVGGSKTSDHLFGRAADIFPLEKDIYLVWDWIVEMIQGSDEFEVHQAIDEFDLRWIHLSYRYDSNDNEILRALKGTLGITKYERLSIGKVI